MSRKLDLTFQIGTNGRTGRWKMFYLGKNRYLGNGRCKSDTESYKKTLANWQKLKIIIDVDVIAKPKPFDKQFAEVIVNNGRKT